MRAIGLIAILSISGVTLAQTGGGGNPKFDQPTESPKSREKGVERSDTRIDLRPKFEKGQSIKLKMEVVNSAQHPAIDVDPLDEPDRPSPAKKGSKSTPTKNRPELETTKSKIDFGIVMNVKDVTTEGVATVDMVFQTVKVFVDGPGGKMEFDSTKPAAPAKPGEIDVIGSVLKPLVGSTFTMTVDRSGNISSVSGGDGFGMLGQVVPGAGGGGSLPQVFGPIFTLKKGDGFARLGESWENVDKLNSGLMGEFKMSTKHTLQSVSGKDAKLAMQGRIEAGSMAPGSSTFQLKDSSYSGKYTWDTGRGMIRDMSTRMSMTVSHQLQGTPVDVTSETNMRVSRID
jgi:hypothetical protein